MYTYLVRPYMPTKFQISILIIENVGPSAPRKGRFVALRRLTQSICRNFFFYEEYAYQISIFYLDKYCKRFENGDVP